ncbi:hypothetical protein AHAS_Ahas16G0121900 [Arachis hypogaea]
MALSLRDMYTVFTLQGVQGTYPARCDRALSLRDMHRVFTLRGVHGTLPVRLACDKPRDTFPLGDAQQRDNDQCYTQDKVPQLPQGHAFLHFPASNIDCWTLGYHEKIFLRHHMQFSFGMDPECFIPSPQSPCWKTALTSHPSYQYSNQSHRRHSYGN